MVAFTADAAVIWDVANSASPSSSQTVMAADAVMVTWEAFNASGDTLSMTLAGAAPTESYQNGSGSNIYLGIWVGAPTGSQTIAGAGLDATDDSGFGMKGIDGIDTGDPFDNQVTDGSPGDESIDITTTADGLAVGVIFHNGAATTLSTSDTEVAENAWSAGTSTNTLGIASAPGTGGVVTVNWTGTGAAIIGINLRNAAAVGGDGTDIPWNPEPGVMPHPPFSIIAY